MLSKARSHKLPGIGACKDHKVSIKLRCCFSLTIQVNINNIVGFPWQNSNSITDTKHEKKGELIHCNTAFFLKRGAKRASLASQLWERHNVLRKASFFGGSFSERRKSRNKPSARGYRPRPACRHSRAHNLKNR